MTISYNYEIASSKSWSFIKILLHWKGSIWKSVFTELFIWLVGYYGIFAVYRGLMTTNQQKLFAEMANYIYSTTEYLPLTFMLGFFVKIVVERWRDIFESMGFIDNVALSVTTWIRGTDKDVVIARRNILRYICLSQVLVLRDISIKVRKRLPTMSSLVAAGFLMPHERKILERIPSLPYDNYWVPMNWACALVQRMRETGKITGDPETAALMTNIFILKDKFLKLCSFDWVPVPIAYIQVVFLTIRVYFVLACVSRQFIISEGSKHHYVDIVFPFMTVIQFILCMGWLKVAEALLNPMGEDDDDFEGNWLIDRNLTIALLMADESYDQVPEQLPDHIDPRQGQLYSEVSAHLPNYPLVGSAIRMKYNQDGDGEPRMVKLRHQLAKYFTPTDSKDVQPLNGTHGNGNGAFVGGGEEDDPSKQYVTNLVVPLTTTPDMSPPPMYSKA